METAAERCRDDGPMLGSALAARDELVDPREVEAFERAEEWLGAVPATLVHVRLRALRGTTRRALCAVLVGRAAERVAPIETGFRSGAMQPCLARWSGSRPV